VGVTTYCAYPTEAAGREKVGDIVVSYEKVLALSPDAVFSSNRLAGRTNEALIGMGFHVVAVDAESFEEIAREIRRLGDLTGHAGKAEEVAADMMRLVGAVEERVAGKGAPTVFFESATDPIWTAGPDSYPGDLIRRAGGRNILHDLGRPWGTVSWEIVLQRDPEIILIAHTQTENLESRAGWSSLRAVRNGRVHRVPKEEFIYPTPRLVAGLERAASLFHAQD